MGDAIVDAYLARIMAVSRDVLGDSLVAGWAVGSLATDDFDVAHSDIDVILIAARAVSPPSKQALAGVLTHDVLACPAHGLDLVMYNEPGLHPVPRVPTYEFSIASGASWDDEISFGGPYPGGLIDLCVARQRGRGLFGPGPRATLHGIADEWILEELLNGLHWHADKVHDSFHDPTGANTVLNACRSLAYLSTTELVSKSEGAQWLLESREVPVVRAALEARRNRRRVVLERAAVLSFLAEATAQFAAGTV